MKPPSFAPSYVWAYPILAEIANEHGYALAIHGSVTRDLDLVAIPWIEEVKAAEDLMQAIAKYVGRYMGGLTGDMVPLSQATIKPHGRLAWAIPLHNGAVIDLSVMPRITEV
jgi:hypothetical protein